eukprot:TRINITY_DN3192_c0_g1_i1.p1 TRINITY_DN3192_c0_g1~~TRINITY_DN3192_c0_g1_i1.p1  ORF type:complete len:295 (-),score=69.03 TRINITY_DN3192_c0_g1_i1:200-1048(-)
MNNRTHFVLIFVLFCISIGLSNCKNYQILITSIQPFPKVVIEEGDTVEWINLDDKTHTVTSTNTQEIWDSGDLLPSNNFIHKFNFEGTYSYHCSYHPDWMTGYVVVRSFTFLSYYDLSGVEVSSITTIDINGLSFETIDNFGDPTNSYSTFAGYYTDSDSPSTEIIRTGGRSFTPYSSNEFFRSDSFETFTFASTNQILLTRSEWDVDTDDLYKYFPHTNIYTNTNHFTSYLNLGTTTTVLALVSPDFSPDPTVIEIIDTGSSYHLVPSLVLILISMLFILF